MKILISFIASLAINSSYPNPEEINRQEVFCLSKAVYHEGRGEPLIGKIAIGHVILNRVKSSSYPNTVCGVVYQPKQFTGIRFRKLGAGDFSRNSWKESVEVATLSYIGFIDDPTNGATMYYNPRKVNDPRWDFTKLTLVGDIYNHRFYHENR